MPQSVLSLGNGVSSVTLGFRLLLILIEGVLSGAGGNQLVYSGLFLGASWSAFLV